MSSTSLHFLDVRGACPAEDGGAIYADEGSNATLDYVDFVGNRCMTEAGAVLIAGTFTGRDLVFTNNSGTAQVLMKAR